MSSGYLRTPTAVKSPTSPAPGYDRYDPHERYDPSTPSPRRQQRPLSRAHHNISTPPGDAATTPSSHRTLRRTPRLRPASPSLPSTDRPRCPVHVEAASVGISSRPLFAIARASPPVEERPRLPRLRSHHSQALSDELDEPFAAPEPDHASPAKPTSTSKPEPHPFVRISKATHSAVLWALEEALRQPHPFSPDLVEENASMAELLGGGGGPVAPAASGAAATTTRPAAAAARTGSPPQAIRGPRVIMRERAEREARQRAEREQMERNRAEEEARLLEEQRQRAAERSRPAAGAGTGSAGTGAAVGGGAGGLVGDIPLDPATQRRQQRAQEAQGGGAAGPQRSQPAASQAHQPPRPTRISAAQTGQGIGGMPALGSIPPSTGPQAGDAATAGVAVTKPRNSFPHAFERWEALSAHWEGMTSFWIRKLQENTEELDRNPLSTQLSRQVSDLSAAGANLFHAVVELQRLRASSERKFQRWFFETRAELERNQEVNGQLQALLEEERRGRAGAIRDAVEHERASSKTQKQLSEMRKELSISKEEARRAWEELGRREQEERDRTLSLQQGLPTIVGGVQVVPMTQGGVPSRQASAREAGRAEAAEYGQPQNPQYQRESSIQGTPSSTPGPSRAGYYQQAPTASREGGGPESEAGYSEGEYMLDSSGNFLRDVNGNKIPFHSPTASQAGGEEEDEGEGAGARGPGGSDVGAAGDGGDGEDDGQDAAAAGQGPPSGPGLAYPPSSSHWAEPSESPEYSGAGYAAPTWETTPQHHHPSRLSNIYEEDDERSRTSASQLSRA